MKKLKRKFRQGLAGFLSFCMTMTSFNMVSWADVGKAFENENATFIMSGEDLRDSAQAAVDSGEVFHVEDLGLGDKDPSLKKEYEKLFEGGPVYEFMPSYDMDENADAEGAELRMFIRVPDNHDGYQLTGDEQIIFLYVNESDGKITFRSDIDGYLTKKVSVKAFSENAAAVSAAGGAGAKPETAVPEETTAADETQAVTDETAGSETQAVTDKTTGSETQAVTDKTTGSETQAVTDETKADETKGNANETAGDETKGNANETAGDQTKADEKSKDPAAVSDDKGKETGNSGNTSEVKEAAGAPDAGAADDNSSKSSGHEDGASQDQGSSDLKVSVSKHVLPILMEASDIIATASEAAVNEESSAAVLDQSSSEGKNEASTGGTSGGKTYGAVLLDEAYYAKAYVTTLNQLHVDVSSEGYGVTYAVEPVGTAYAEGPKTVAEDGTLSFTVIPQVGYEVSDVTVNGETVAADDGEGSHYTVTGVTEEQEVVITTAMTGVSA